MKQRRPMMTTTLSDQRDMQDYCKQIQQSPVHQKKYIKITILVPCAFLAICIPSSYNNLKTRNFNGKLLYIYYKI